MCNYNFIYFFKEISILHTPFFTLFSFYLNLDAIAIQFFLKSRVSFSRLYCFGVLNYLFHYSAIIAGYMRLKGNVLFCKKVNRILNLVIYCLFQDLWGQ